MSMENLQEESKKENLETENTVSKNALLSSNSADIIKEELSKIENEYAGQYPVYDEKEIFKGLEYKDDRLPNSQEIEDIAKEDLKPFKDVNIKEITDEYKTDLDALALKEKSIKEQYESKTEDIKQDLEYSLAYNQAQNIKNGVQVSSIADNGRQMIADRIDGELQDAFNKTSTDLAELALKRSIAENEFQVALEKFDIAYASKLEKKITDLNSEYIKKQAEAEKYNAKIESQRQKVLEEWRKSRDELTSHLDAEKGKEKAFYVINKLSQLSKAEALNLLEDKDIKNELQNWLGPVKDYVERVLK